MLLMMRMLPNLLPAATCRREGLQLAEASFRDIGCISHYIPNISFSQILAES
jgi:hypothetical protein